MPQTDNNTTLLALAAQYSITDKDLAAALYVSPHTVRAWRLPPTCKARRNVTDATLALFKQHLRGN